MGRLPVSERDADPYHRKPDQGPLFAPQEPPVDEPKDKSTEEKKKDLTPPKGEVHSKT